MKTIYIHGSFGSNNYGDYLLYKIAIDSIKNYYINTDEDVKIITENASELYQKLSSINILPVNKAIKKCDAIVFVGGGYLGEPGKNISAWNRHFLKAHAAPLFFSRFLKKKTAIIGVGSGPISNVLIKKIVSFSINNASTISVRDVESKDFFCSLNPNLNISVHPDWVMSSAFDRFVEDNSTIEENRMFVHVTGNTMDQINDICDALIAIRKEHPDICFTFGTDNTKTKQYDVARYLSSKVGNNNDRLSLFSDPYNLIKELSKCGYILTDKLHVGITGIRMGKKVLALPIHPKIYRFYNQIGYNTEYVIGMGSLTSELLFSRLNSLIENNDIFDIKSIISDADNNITILNEFLSTVK